MADAASAPLDIKASAAASLLRDGVPGEDVGAAAGLQRALALGTLFEVNQLKKQRDAARVQKACDDAAVAEIVFLPKLPAARTIATATWANDPMKLSAQDRAVAVSEVNDLKEVQCQPIQ